MVAATQIFATNDVTVRSARRTALRVRSECADSDESLLMLPDNSFGVTNDMAHYLHVQFLDKNWRVRTIGHQTSVFLAIACQARG